MESQLPYQLMIYFLPDLLWNRAGFWGPRGACPVPIPNGECDSNQLHCPFFNGDVILLRVYVAIL